MITLVVDTTITLVIIPINATPMPRHRPRRIAL
ncbi:hypothetical protein 2.14 [Burkholderia phage Bups phi1]|nr:hypothetical protein 2.14 [Burkholderia phage Bups phi1]